jgi:hypothetical protein
MVPQCFICNCVIIVSVFAIVQLNQRHSDRQESFPGDGNHDVHKITHSAESERFGRYG